MSNFYEAYRTLYTVLFGEQDHRLAAVLKDEDRISALHRTLSKAEALLSGIEAAYAKARADGEDSRTWLREVRRATFVTGALRDLLIEAEDGSEQIRAARAAIDAVNGQLERISKSTDHLLKNLGEATSGIDAIAKLLTLIG